MVSSTNNKAVDNVIEKLNEWLKYESLEPNFLYIKGGSQKNIHEPGAAREQLQKGVEYIEKNSFDKIRFDELKQRIEQIKREMLAKESNYQKARTQRYLDEERLPHILEEIQTIQQDLDDKIATKSNWQRRAADLAEYEQLPIEAYRKIELRFSKAEGQLPKRKIILVESFMALANSGKPKNRL